MPALQRGAPWAEQRLLAALRQSVPQNGRVHLHIIEEKPKSSLLTGRFDKRVRIDLPVPLRAKH